ncbi:invasion associated locus B family protein [Ruegeria halocynthiae]|uniref:invasion associated locus B family protein n=1 Tax=Ruegeria halocynthiae TaxID=985054 RepID=UPI00055AC710|nr:invasion associated locus B family protein [Ruegeria halocynthiae]
MRWFFFLLLAPISAFAQDLQGNDTAGNWRVTHYEPFGVWNSICDEREENQTLRQRCYIRRAEVFSYRPKFGAQFIFITPEADGYQIEFGIEPGTLYWPSGFRIDDSDGVVWRTRSPGCLTGLSCTFQGRSAQDILDAMQKGDAYRFVFRDRHGQAQDLTWPLAGFDAAWNDFQKQARARDLLSQ